jgi:hypothetical protein
MGISYCWMQLYICMSLCSSHCSLLILWVQKSMGEVYYSAHGGCVVILACVLSLIATPKFDEERESDLQSEYCISLLIPWIWCHCCCCCGGWLVVFADLSDWDRGWGVQDYIFPAYHSYSTLFTWGVWPTRRVFSVIKGNDWWNVEIGSDVQCDMGLPERNGCSSLLLLRYGIGSTCVDADLQRGTSL